MKILIAEDDPVYRKMLETMLVKWGYEVIIPVTMSIGATASIEGKATDIDSIIHTADNALYRAKNNGRNRVEFAIL